MNSKKIKKDKKDKEDSLVNPVKQPFCIGDFDSIETTDFKEPIPLKNPNLHFRSKDTSESARKLLKAIQSRELEVPSHADLLNSEKIIKVSAMHFLEREKKLAKELKVAREKAIRHQTSQEVTEIVNELMGKKRDPPKYYSFFGALGDEEHLFPKKKRIENAPGGFHIKLDENKAIKLKPADSEQLERLRVTPVPPAPHQAEALRLWCTYARQVYYYFGMMCAISNELGHYYDVWRQYGFLKTYTMQIDREQSKAAFWQIAKRELEAVSEEKYNPSFVFNRQREKYLYKGFGARLKKNTWIALFKFFPHKDLMWKNNVEKQYDPQHGIHAKPMDLRDHIFVNLKLRFYYELVWRSVSVNQGRFGYKPNVLKDYKESILFQRITKKLNESRLSPSTTKMILEKYAVMCARVRYTEFEKLKMPCICPFYSEYCPTPMNLVVYEDTDKSEYFGFHCQCSWDSSYNRLAIFGRHRYPGCTCTPDSYCPKGKPLSNMFSLSRVCAVCDKRGYYGFECKCCKYALCDKCGYLNLNNPKPQVARCYLEDFKLKK